MCIRDSPMAAAVSTWSPVIITGVIPALSHSSIAALTSGLTGSIDVYKRQTPMCNKNKITARKEETHAEVTDSQRRNAPL